jgi:hypothetical protein
VRLPSLLVGVCLSVVVVPAASAEDAPRQRHTTTRRTREKIAVRQKVAPPSVVAPVTIEPPAPPPGLTLVAGAVSVATTFEMSLSANSSMSPSSIAPDFSVGITNDLTLSLVHSGSALTGFRGGAGAGFCFTGPDQGKCETSYSGGGAEALYSLTRGNTAIAGNAGFVLSSIKPTRKDLKLGLKTKLTLGKTSVVFNPSIWYALDARDNRMAPHEDQLFLPVSVWNKVTPQLSLGVGTGVRAPLKHFGAQYAVPVGGLVQVALNPRVAVGSSLVFGRVVGGSELMNPDPGLDARVVQIWLSVASH